MNRKELLTAERVQLRTFTEDVGLRVNRRTAERAESIVRASNKAILAVPPLVPNSPEESATTAKRSQRNSPDARCPLWGGVSPRWRGTTARLVFVASPTVIPRTSEELPGGNGT